MESNELSPTPAPHRITEYDWARIAFECTCLISIFGSLFVIYSTFRFEALQKKAFRLIFWLSVSDFGANVATMFLREYCFFQASILQFFSTAAILWPLMIALKLYGAVNMKGVEEGSRNYLVLFIENPKLLHLFVWGMSLATTIPPIITNSYGRAGEWCWIIYDKKPNSIASIERFVCFYIIVWIVFILSSICYCAVYRALKRIVELNMAGDASSVQLDIVLRLMNTLKYYPLIFLLSWLPSSAFRLLEDLFPTARYHPLYISLFTVFKGSVIQGILDAIAYATTPAVKQSWSNVFSSCRRQQSFQPFFYESSLDSTTISVTASSRETEGFAKSLSDSYYEEEYDYEADDISYPSTPPQNHQTSSRVVVVDEIRPPNKETLSQPLLRDQA